MKIPDCARMTTMIKTILILFLLLPAVIYSQPDYLKRSNVLEGENNQKNTDYRKKSGIKSQTDYFIDSTGNKILQKRQKFDRNGNTIEWKTYDKEGKISSELFTEYDGTKVQEVKSKYYYK